MSTRGHIVSPDGESYFVTENRSVGGSIPPLGTMISTGSEAIWFRQRDQIQDRPTPGPPSILIATGAGGENAVSAPRFFSLCSDSPAALRWQTGASQTAVAA